MELWPFVAVTCQGCGFQRDWGVFGRICSCVAAARTPHQPPPHHHPPFIFFSVVFLGFDICRVLISVAEGAGMRGMQASGLPVYSEGFLQYPPTPPSWFPFKDFSHFCPCCFGNRSRARRTGASCSIPEFFPTAFSYSPVGFLFFLPPQNSTV